MVSEGLLRPVSSLCSVALHRPAFACSQPYQLADPQPWLWQRIILLVPLQGCELRALAHSDSLVLFHLLPKCSSSSCHSPRCSPPEFARRSFRYPGSTFSCFHEDSQSFHVHCTCNCGAACLPQPCWSMAFSCQLCEKSVFNDMALNQNDTDNDA